MSESMGLKCIFCASRRSPSFQSITAKRSARSKAFGLHDTPTVVPGIRQDLHVITAIVLNEMHLRWHQSARRNLQTGQVNLELVSKLLPIGKGHQDDQALRSPL